MPLCFRKAIISPAPTARPVLLEMLVFLSIYLETSDPHMLMTSEKRRSRGNDTLETRMLLETKQPSLFSSCHPDIHASD